jgi:ribosomal protein S18 acetylase RimI-like enzyme
VGLGSHLLTFGLQNLARMSMQRVACAVDERNAPARRLYDRLGFSRFDTREAFVRRP